MTTPILGITEISGNQQNQYITANEAFRALEAASNGFLTVDLAAGTVTLTAAQFTAAYAFYGVGHSVTTVLNVPASKRAFVVINGGTGNITVTRGAGTKAIAPGESMMLLTDGTSDGLYSVGGGGGGGAAVWGAITGTLSDQADLQAALNAKADASALGTMAAQNANAVAITGGSIDGTPIGATTRAAGNFNAVSVNGNLSVIGAARRILGIFNGSPTSDRTLIQSSSAGSFTSVGMIPPVGGTNSGLAAYSNTDVDNSQYLQFSCSNVVAAVDCGKTGSAANVPLSFYVAGSSILTCNTNGNVGIGVANPVSHKLEVNGRLYASGGIVFPPFLKTTVPSAAANTNAGVIVTDAASGRRPYWSNGTDWRDAANVVLS